MLMNFFTIMAGFSYVIGKGYKEQFREIDRKIFIEQQGYNQERQNELERMCFSYLSEQRKAFDDLLGRVVKRKDLRAVYDAIREISVREGWKYYDINELFSNTQYRKIMGYKK